MDKVVVRELAAGAGSAALVTILRVKGSAPRHEGAAMLVHASGAVTGTVGGGRGEAAAIAAARRALDTGTPELIEVEMTGDDPTAESLICGGVNTMLVEPLPDRSAYVRVHALLEKGERVLVQRQLPPAASVGALSPGNTASGALPTRVIAESEAGPEHAAVLASGEPRYDEATGRFMVPVMPDERLVILGGGHVGLALANAAVPLGFLVTVIDDRAGFSSASRFPDGVVTIHGSYVDSIDSMHFDRATYAVIVTRGHLFDLECARAVLQRPFRYAGLIGSARKVALIRKQLADEGIAPEALQAFCAPIGLDIGAETPEEIAISILAQALMFRRSTSPGKSAPFMF